MLSRLRTIDTWIFDLDNTLYPASSDLFGLMDVRMGDYVARLLGVATDEARAIQKRYFREHGTTLAGLIAHHAVDPQDYLDYVHDIALDVLVEDRRLVRAIAALPGRKLIFTNGDAPYAHRVLARLGLSDSFEAVHDIHACAYRPKPDPAVYAGMCDRFAIDPTVALFVEDMARNLKPAKALGMTTVWLNNGSELGGDGAHRDFIDYEIADLGEWLDAILEEDKA